MAPPHRHTTFYAIFATGLACAVGSILVGSLFVASVYFAGSAEDWAREGRRLSGFLRTYALALAGGFAVQAVFGVLFCWLIRATRFASPAGWVFAGAALGIAVPWAFARAGYLVEGWRFPADLQGLKSALTFPLMGAMMYELQPLWVQAAIGMATGVALGVLIRALWRGRAS